MLTVSQPIVSMEMYLLFSFIGFLVYAFLYLSYQGILTGKREVLHNRPPVAGFDSMRGGTSGTLPQDHTYDENPEQTEIEGFFFDHQATFQDSKPAMEPENAASETDTNRSEPKSEIVSEENSEEDNEDYDWPTPGEYTPTEVQYLCGRQYVGELSLEEQQFLARVRYNLETDSDAYPYLNDEYQEIQERLSRLIVQTGKSQEEIVTDHLTSREKVIFNAVSMERPNSVS